MTISELIALLQQYDPDMRVLVDGYECDFDDINATAVRSVSLNPRGHDWEGDWELGNDEKALILSRGDSIEGS